MKTKFKTQNRKQNANSQVIIDIYNWNGTTPVFS